MSAMASQITSLTIVYSNVYLAVDQGKHQTPRHWPLWGEFTGDRWIPAQRASNAENVSIWWRHNDISRNSDDLVWVLCIYRSRTLRPMFSSKITFASILIVTCICQFSQTFRKPSVHSLLLWIHIKRTSVTWNLWEIISQFGAAPPRNSKNIPFRNYTLQFGK